MDWQVILNTVGGLATMLVAGYVRFVQSQLDKSRAELSIANRDLNDFKIKVAENYITHQDLRRIEDALVRIEAKIEVKADK